MNISSFRGRQFATLMILAIVPMALILGVALPLTRAAVIQQTFEQLEIVADLKTNEVEGWLNDGKEVAHLISTLHDIKEAVPVLFNILGENESLEVRAHILGTLKEISSGFPQVHSVSLLDPTDGIIILSTDPTLEGRNRSIEDFFNLGKNELYVSAVTYSVGREAPILVISSPILNDFQELIAVVAVELDLRDLGGTMASKIGLGNTGRTYLIEGYGFYVTLPEQVAGGPLRTIAESEGARQVIAGENGSGIYSDPNGDRVLGVYRWIEGPHLGLMVEIEETEIIQEYSKTWSLIFLGALILIFIAVFIARSLTSWLLRPLDAISEAARALQAGNWDQRAPEDGPLEINALAGAFNEMSAGLQLSYQNLEEMVEMRTVALRSTEARLDGIVQTAPDAVISIDRFHRVLMFNEAAESMFGYTAGEIVGKNIEKLIPEEFVKTHSLHINEFEKSTQNSRKMNSERLVLGRRKNGEEFPLEASTTKVLIEGEVILTAIARDITKRVEAENMIKASLEEKETLLREIHHRVKNNMQIMSSMLYLQIGNVSDPASLDMLQASQNRIRSMALIHEKLYQTDNLTNIDFRDYVNSLVDHLTRIYSVGKSKVEVEVLIDDVYLDADLAITCGLITNELISNSLNYAFPLKRKGKITILLEETNPGEYLFEISDNGVGLPKDLEFPNKGSLGMRLVKNLVMQLGGELEVSKKNGTQYSIEFKIIDTDEIMSELED